MVGVREVAVDGGLEVDDRSEDAALQAALGQRREEGLDRVEPGAGGRGEVEGEARMAGEPGDHLRVLVGGVVVEDDVDELTDRHRRLEGVEETDEFLVSMALHTAAEDRAVEHVEGGKQGGGAVALVVMGHGAGPALLQRQAGLGAVEGLDLALLVDREHHRMGGRIDIEADDVAQLRHELGIVGELEAAYAVRLKAVSLPDALHRGQADADRLGHGGGGPVRRLVRRLGCGQGHRLVDHLLTERLDARGPGLVPQKAVDALLDEALLPAPDAGLRLAGPAHDRDHADTVRRQQHDLGPPDMLLRAVAVARDYRQTAAVGGSDGEGDAGAHAPDSHASARRPKSRIASVDLRWLLKPALSSRQELWNWWSRHQLPMTTLRAPFTAVEDGWCAKPDGWRNGLRARPRLDVSAQVR